MENFFKNLKNKLSIENVMELVDDGKVIDEDTIKENVISDLEEIKTNSYINYDEIQTELDNIKKNNEHEEKKDEKDLKESESHRSNVEKVNEVTKEQPKPREKRDLPIFF